MRPIFSLPGADGGSITERMDRPIDAQTALFENWRRRVFFSSAFGLLMWMFLDRQADALLVSGIWMMICGLDAIATFVRWLNLRDDPRHAKRPPNHP